MTKFGMAAVIALVGSYLAAQTHERELQKPKTTTWKGILVDSGCRSPHSERLKPTSDSRSYPVTSTTSYGLIMAGGKCIPFDVGSNEKVSGLLKMKKDWTENTVKVKPTKVEILGTEHDGEISVDEIQISSPAR